MKEACLKCDGFGWIWWEELDNYSGPASDSRDCYLDNTKYICDHCGGKSYIETGKDMPEEAPW